MPSPISIVDEVSPPCGIEYIDLAPFGPSGKLPSASTCADWSELPVLRDLCEKLTVRGISFADVPIAIEGDGARLKAGPFDLHVGPGPDAADPAAVDLCLDAIAAAAARRLMLASRGARSSTPDWACTVSLLLDEACDTFGISHHDLWHAGRQPRQGAAPPPRGLQQATRSRIELHRIGSRIGFRAEPQASKSRVVVSDVDGPSVWLDAAYPPDQMSRLVGRRISSLLPIKSIPLFGLLQFDPLIATARRGGDGTGVSREGLRLSFEVPTTTLGLAPQVAMTAIGLERPHTDRKVKPWLEASGVHAHVQGARAQTTSGALPSARTTSPISACEPKRTR